MMVNFWLFYCLYESDHRRANMGFTAMKFVEILPRIWRIELKQGGLAFQKVERLWPKGRFFGSVFYLLTVPYHAAKFEKILRADPGIYAWLVLCHNWARIAHLAQKKNFSEIFFERFLYTYCAFPCCKVWKKSLARILR